MLWFDKGRDFGRGLEHELWGDFGLGYSFFGRQRNIAFAAVATTLAALATMIGAGVLGAIGADVRGRFATNAAGENGCVDYHR